MVELGTPSRAAKEHYWKEMQQLKSKYPTSWVTETHPRPPQLSIRPQDEELLLAACIDAMMITGLW